MGAAAMRNGVHMSQGGAASVAGAAPVARLFWQLARRIGPHSDRLHPPPAVLQQFWSTVNVPLIWAAAGSEESCSELQWLEMAAHGLEAGVAGIPDANGMA